METIWEVTLAITDELTVRLPQGATPLSVGNQADSLAAWFRVNPDAPLRSRRIRIFGTGHELLDEGFSYLGTAITGRGSWHVFIEVAP